MKILLKIGGRAFSNEKGFQELAGSICRLAAPCIVVHGGGSEISEALKAAGREIRFVDGIRVTEAEDVEIVEKVLSGTVNSRIVQYLIKAGCPCQRMSGKTGRLILVTPMKSRNGMEVGFVGQVSAVNPVPIEAVLSEKMVPVVSPISADAQGHTYNVNADSAAAALAVGVGCTDLIYFTDVPGVKVKDRILARISESEVHSLIASGDITGGMVAKLESALKAVEGGVERVHIAQWTGSLEEILGPDALSGTTVHRDFD
jgi:acetylglutamate kinase